MMNGKRTGTSRSILGKHTTCDLLLIGPDEVVVMRSHIACGYTCEVLTSRNRLALVLHPLTMYIKPLQNFSDTFSVIAVHC